MRRVLIAVALSIALIRSLSAVPGASARAKAIDSYCSPTGDYCTIVTRQNGRIKLIIRQAEESLPTAREWLASEERTSGS